MLQVACVCGEKFTLFCGGDLEVGERMGELLPFDLSLPLPQQYKLTVNHKAMVVKHNCSV